MMIRSTALVAVTACAAPAAVQPATPKSVPVLHGASVQGPFPDEATLCRRVYEAEPDCLRRSHDRITGPTVAGTDGFGRVEIVEAGLYDDRCALVFQIADRFYIHDQPGLCTSTGHSHYMPTVRTIGFRDLDGTSPRELVIVADVEVARDDVAGPPVPPLAIAVVCGQRGGGTPSCIEATTDTPEQFVATHAFRF